jgi:hypothetical protein
MSLPTAIRSALVGNSALGALTGERIFYLRFQQGDTQPAVVFRTLDNVHQTTHAGTSVLLEPEVRLTLRAERLSQIETMRQAITDQFIAPEVALDGYAAVHAQINDLGAEYDDKLRVYHHYITLNLQMRTS